MADKEIPAYRCTYCLQALTEDDRQNLFGSDGTRPKSDEADNFVTEAQTILKYAAAVALLFHAAEKESDDAIFQLHQLTGELMDEALRRLERAQEALEIVWEREKAAKKSPLSRKEGV